MRNGRDRSRHSIGGPRLSGWRLDFISTRRRRGERWTAGRQHLDSGYVHEPDCRPALRQAWRSLRFQNSDDREVLAGDDQFLAGDFDRSSVADVKAKRSEWSSVEQRQHGSCVEHGFPLRRRATSMNLTKSQAIQRDRIGHGSIISRRGHPCLLREAHPAMAVGFTNTSAIQ